MNVKEVKELLPLADIVELKKYKRYIIFVKPSRIIGGSSISSGDMARLAAKLQENGIKAIFIKCDPEDFKIMELVGD